MTAPSSLIGYAVLRANFNAAAPSYVDNFAPFAVDVLAQEYPAAITEHEVAQAIQDRFGLRVPDRVVGVLLKRAVQRERAIRTKAGFVATDAHRNSGGSSITADMERFQRQQRELVAKYAGFIDEALPEHAGLSDQNPEAQLSEFIERNAVPLLRQAVKGGPGTNSARMRGSDYAVSRFIAHLADHDNTAFGYVEEAVKGCILASVVNLDTTRFKQSLKDVTIYLDTPVLLKALGFEDESQRLAVGQTITLARELGINVSCFEHSVSELDGVLVSAQDAMRAKGRRSGIVRAVDAHFQDSGLSAADIELERARVPDALTQLGIRARAKPDSYYAYGLDESALDALLQGHVRYLSDRTRRYDVESLSAIHRLRKGSSPYVFERCEFVLVTDNAKLAFASRSVNERHGWPLAMLDGELAALLWARSPVIAADLPRQQLLAAVYSGMQPSPHLWSRYLTEIEHLQGSGDINEDEAIILRSRPEARRALMDVTLGEAEELDDESTVSVVERVRAGLEEPMRHQLEVAENDKVEAVAAAAARAQEVSANAQQVELALGAMNRELTSQIDLVSKEVADLKNQSARQDASIRQRAESAASRSIVGPVYTFGVACAAFAALKYTNPAWLATAPFWVGRLALGATVLIIVLGALRQFKAGSVADWARPLTSWLANCLERRYRKKAGLAPQRRGMA